MGSKDMEDIITIIEGSTDCFTALNEAPSEVRSFLVCHLKALLLKEQFLKAEKDAEIVELRARADKAESESALIKALLRGKFPDAAICAAMDPKPLSRGWHPPMWLH